MASRDGGSDSMRMPDRSSAGDPMSEDDGLKVFTIGHSNHPIEEFLELLRLYSVETVADVRSRPASRYYPHFRQQALKNALGQSDIKYVFFGDELGGKPASNEMYDHQGHVIYERLAATSAFRSGIQRVGKLLITTRLALMCTEADPAECHRHPLIATYLVERDIQVQHILRDGTVRDAAFMFNQAPSQQMPLLEPPGEDLSWRSPKRIR